MAEDLGPSQLVVIEYHRADEFTFPEQAMRTDFYGSPYQPHAIFDGYESHAGSPGVSEYEPTVNQHLTEPAPLTIDDLSFEIDSNSQIANIAATISVEQEISAANVEIWAILTETPVQGWQFDSDWYKYVCRDVAMQPVTISQPGQSESFTFEMDVAAEWETDNLDAVVFVQDKISKHIHQAATAEPGGAVDIEPNDPSALQNGLGQNYPNPFNPTTQVPFSLARSGRVTVDVYALDGSRVKTLMDREQPAGTHEVRWDGTNSRGETVGSGLYLYRLTTDEITITRSMILMK